MAVANFFERATIGASQVLRGFNIAGFTRAISSATVGVAYDQAAAESQEGAATLALTVNLLSRLYPAIAIVPVGRGARRHQSGLVDLARAINPAIELKTRPKALSACIAVGNTAVTSAWNPVYVGSLGWIVRLSVRRPVGSGTSTNPFGAGAAACFGAAHVFRTVFADQVPAGRNEDFDLSLFTYDCTALDNPEFDQVQAGEVHLVGLGAIGNGAVWALSRAAGVRGTLHLIDHECVDLSNLQRYVLGLQRHIGQAKVEIAQRCFGADHLLVQAHAQRWGEYLAGRSDWSLPQVVVAVDTALDRIAIQSALPKWVLNAWTQPGDLGISRHDFVSDHACLACLYLPDRKVPDEDELIATAIGLPDQRMEVRRRLHAGIPLDEGFLETITNAIGIPAFELSRFVGQSLRVFYREAICGGALFRLTDGQQMAPTTVPMAFQSALAGIMLAAELVAHNLHTARVIPTITSIDLLRPLPTHLSFWRKKSPSGRCLCQDPDFIDAYRSKYENPALGPA